MPVDPSRLMQDAKSFARYASLAYSTVQDGITTALVQRKVGRNGWAVMVAMCRKVYGEGNVRRISAEEIAERTGLTAAQVARGMRELRERNIIVPIIRKNSKGKRSFDRSSFGHVAQYCITTEVWRQVALAENGSQDTNVGLTERSE